MVYLRIDYYYPLRTFVTRVDVLQSKSTSRHYVRTVVTKRPLPTKFYTRGHRIVSTEVRFETMTGLLAIQNALRDFFHSSANSTFFFLFLEALPEIVS